MKYINDININEAVVHVLDKNLEEPLLNDFNLEMDEDTYRYIYTVVNKCLTDEKIKYAKFFDTNSIVNITAQRYFQGVSTSEGILDLSKEFAKRLFEIMSGNSGISSSDLLVAAITTDQGPMIAILKMDYEDKNYGHDVKFIDEKTEISLVKYKTGLPKTASKVQKAAFILPTGNEFDLMILDKKASSAESYGDNYFINTFLKAQYEANERDITKLFIEGLEGWVTRKHACAAIKAECVRSVIRSAISENDSVVIEDLAEELYLGTNEQEEFVDYCKEIKLPTEVTFDKIWIEKKKSKITLDIERDIKLVLGSKIYNNPSRFEIQANTDGSVNFVIKNVMNYYEK